MIACGKVHVNGRPVRELGTQVDASDEVRVDGTVVRPPDEPTYLVLHKPVGVVTTMRDPQGRSSVAQFLPPGPRIVPVGRLDYDTSGVLLMTNDGELAHRLLHPSHGVEKTYRVTIAGRLDSPDVRRVTEGFALAEFRVAAAKIRVVAVRRGCSVVDVTIHEGRNRQIRRMFDALGHPVSALCRLRFGPIRLGELAAGHVRALTSKERAAIERYRRPPERISRTKAT